MTSIQLTSAQLAELTRAHIAYFDAAPDHASLTFHTGRLLADIEAGIAFDAALQMRADHFYDMALTSPPTSVGIADLSDQDFIRLLYGSVLLRPGSGGEAPGDAEISYWVAQLGSGSLARNEMPMAFLDAVDSLKAAGTPDEQAMASRIAAVLDNKVEVAAEFARPENSAGMTPQEAREAGKAILAGVSADRASVEDALSALPSRPAPSSGEGTSSDAGGGDSTPDVDPPAPTFGVAESDGTLTFAGTASGDIVLTTDAGGAAVFSRGGMVAVARPVLVGGSTVIELAEGQVLAGRADQLSGIEITGAGMVRIFGHDGAQDLRVLAGGDNAVEAGGGADTIEIGQGRDTLVVKDGGWREAVATQTLVRLADPADVAVLSIEIGGAVVAAQSPDVESAGDHVELAAALEAAIGLPGVSVRAVDDMGAITADPAAAVALRIEAGEGQDIREETLVVTTGAAREDVEARSDAVSPGSALMPASPDEGAAVVDAVAGTPGTAPARDTAATAVERVAGAQAEPSQVDDTAEAFAVQEGSVAVPSAPDAGAVVRSLENGSPAAGAVVDAGAEAVIVQAGSGPTGPATDTSVVAIEVAAGIPGTTSTADHGAFATEVQAGMVGGEGGLDTDAVAIASPWGGTDISVTDPSVVDSVSIAFGDVVFIADGDMVVQATNLLELAMAMSLSLDFILGQIEVTAVDLIGYPVMDASAAVAIHLVDRLDRTVDLGSLEVVQAGTPAIASETDIVVSDPEEIGSVAIEIGGVAVIADSAQIQAATDYPELAAALQAELRDIAGFEFVSVIAIDAQLEGGVPRLRVIDPQGRSIDEAALEVRTAATDAEASQSVIALPDIEGIASLSITIDDVSLTCDDPALAEAATLVELAAKVEAAYRLAPDFADVSVTAADLDEDGEWDAIEISDPLGRDIDETSFALVRAGQSSQPTIADIVVSDPDAVASLSIMIGGDTYAADPSSMSNDYAGLATALAASAAFAADPNLLVEPIDAEGHVNSNGGQAVAVRITDALGRDIDVSSLLVEGTASEAEPSTIEFAVTDPDLVGSISLTIGSTLLTAANLEGSETYGDLADALGSSLRGISGFERLTAVAHDTDSDGSDDTLRIVDPDGRTIQVGSLVIRTEGQPAVKSIADVEIDLQEPLHGFSIKIDETVLAVDEAALAGADTLVKLADAIQSGIRAHSGFEGVEVVVFEEAIRVTDPLGRGIDEASLAVTLAGTAASASETAVTVSDPAGVASISMEIGGVLLVADDPAVGAALDHAALAAAVEAGFRAHPDFGTVIVQAGEGGTLVVIDEAGREIGEETLVVMNAGLAGSPSTATVMVSDAASVATFEIEIGGEMLRAEGAAVEDAATLADLAAALTAGFRAVEGFGSVTVEAVGAGEGMAGLRIVDPQARIIDAGTLHVVNGPTEAEPSVTDLQVSDPADVSSLEIAIGGRLFRADDAQIAGARDYVELAAAIADSADFASDAAISIIAITAEGVATLDADLASGLRLGDANGRGIDGASFAVLDIGYHVDAGAAALEIVAGDAATWTPADSSMSAMDVISGFDAADDRFDLRSVGGLSMLDDGNRTLLQAEIDLASQTTTLDAGAAVVLVRSGLAGEGAEKVLTWFTLDDDTFVYAHSAGSPVPEETDLLWQIDGLHALSESNFVMAS